MDFSFLRSGNGLKALPENVAALASLRILRLSNNALTALPPELGSLQKLEEVHVDGNSGLEQRDLVELLRQRPGVRIVGGDKPGTGGCGKQFA